MQNVKILPALASHMVFGPSGSSPGTVGLCQCLSPDESRWVLVDPGGSGWPVPSSAQWQISDGSWLTKAGILRHFSVNEAPVVQTSQARPLLCLLMWFPSRTETIFKSVYIHKTFSVTPMWKVSSVWSATRQFDEHVRKSFEFLWHHLQPYNLLASALQSMKQVFGWIWKTKNCQWKYFYQHQYDKADCNVYQAAVILSAKRNSNGSDESTSRKILSPAKSNWKHTLRNGNWMFEEPWMPRDNTG